MSEYRKSLLYCILFCLVLATVAAYDLHVSYLNEEQATRMRVTNASYLVGEWIKGSMQNSDYVLRDIVGHVPLTELRYPDPDPVRQARISAFIDAKRKTLPNAVGVGLSDEHCIVTHTNAKVGVDASQREWCQAAQADPQRETFVSHMYLNQAGRLSVTQVRRFPDSSSGLHGLAGIAVDLNFFSNWLEQAPVGQHGTIMIADTWLSLLARKPAVPDMLGKTVNQPLLKAFVASGKSFTTFHSQSLLDGESRLYGVRKVGDLPFIIVSGEADADWLAGWRQRAWGAMIALLLLWGMAILILREHWALLRQQEALSQMANTDTLAGIANRRYFISKAEMELNRAQRYNSNLAILMLDIDNFKQINDTHGHALGDLAIVGFVDACQRVLRRIDLLGRFGGDEFAILLPDTTPAEARVVAERLRREIEANKISNNEGVTLSMTSSIGVTMAGMGIADVDAALAKADAALYLAKQNGRNRVEFAD
jgi:diguanylate cyclase (GGDEF)-like protein